MALSPPARIMHSKQETKVSVPSLAPRRNSITREASPPIRRNNLPREPFILPKMTSGNLRDHDKQPQRRVMADCHDDNYALHILASFANACTKEHELRNCERQFYDWIQIWHTMSHRSFLMSTYRTSSLCDVHRLYRQHYLFSIACLLQKYLYINNFTLWFLFHDPFQCPRLFRCCTIGQPGKHIRQHGQWKIHIACNLDWAITAKQRRI